MQLTWLTNNDNNLQEKMRFFSDYFSFANEYLGRLPDILYDNPQSLISKIIYQIENNIQRSPRYIESHAEQLIFFFGDFLLQHFPEYQAVETGLSAYGRCNKKENDRANWLIANPAFLNDLHTLYDSLDKRLFEKSYLQLLNYIVCKHKIRTHQKEIIFHSVMLVSLFRMNGHSKEQVADYIGRILSSDRFEFPFPLAMYDHSKDPSFIPLAEEFMVNRDFQKQFEGLKNLMINPKHRRGYFIYAIDKVEIDKKITKQFKLVLDKVTFISPDHPQFRSLKKVYEMTIKKIISKRIQDSSENINCSAMSIYFTRTRTILAKWVSRSWLKNCPI